MESCKNHEKVLIYSRYDGFWCSLGKKYTSRSAVPIPVEPRRIGNTEKAHELVLHYAPGIGFFTTMALCTHDIFTLSILLHSLLSISIGLAIYTLD